MVKGRREEGRGRGRGWREEKVEDGREARRWGGGVGEEEEVASSKEDAFPMEMHSGWCLLASLCIMRGQPIVMQINSDDNTLSSTTSRLREVSHRASANANRRPHHHLSLIMFPAPLWRGLFSATTPCTSQLLPAPSHSAEVTTPRYTT